jgi:epoxide hydrolase-like predicted phosphatase
VSYQGLILDFGGVVTTDMFAELSAFCIREGLDPGAFARVLNDDREGRNAFEDVESAKISQREFEATIGRRLGVDDRGLLARALGGLRPRPEVLSLIQRAREAGIRVGLLSNSWGDGQYDLYAGYDLDGIFDAVVISGDTGTRKPDAAIYLIATDELGVSPRECVFADDTAANLPVAEELGMATVHFTDAAKGIREISRLLGLSLRAAGDKPPPGPISGSSGHKITARAAAARIAVPSSVARVSAASYSGQDATKVTGPSGGSGCTQKLPSHRRALPPLLPCSKTRRPGSSSLSGGQ